MGFTATLPTPTRGKHRTELGAQLFPQKSGLQAQRSGNCGTPPGARSATEPPARRPGSLPRALPAGTGFPPGGFISAAAGRSQWARGDWISGRAVGGSRRERPPGRVFQSVLNPQGPSHLLHPPPSCLRGRDLLAPGHGRSLVGPS